MVHEVNKLLQNVLVGLFIGPGLVAFLGSCCCTTANLWLSIHINLITNTWTTIQTVNLILWRHDMLIVVTQHKRLFSVSKLFYASNEAEAKRKMQALVAFSIMQLAVTLLHLPQKYLVRKKCPKSVDCGSWCSKLSGIFKCIFNNSMCTCTNILQCEASICTQYSRHITIYESWR